MQILVFLIHARVLTYVNSCASLKKFYRGKLRPARSNSRSSTIAKIETALNQSATSVLEVSHQLGVKPPHLMDYFHLSNGRALFKLCSRLFSLSGSRDAFVKSNTQNNSIDSRVHC